MVCQVPGFSRRQALAGEVLGVREAWARAKAFMVTDGRVLPNTLTMPDNAPPSAGWIPGLSSAPRLPSELRQVARISRGGGIGVGGGWRRSSPASAAKSETLKTWGKAAALGAGAGRGR